MQTQTNSSSADHDSRSRYTHAVGTKFNADGSLRRFPGNTVVSMVEPDTAIDRWLQATTEAVERIRGPELSMLPPSSWHMTVFELLLDEVRDPAHWSDFISPAAPISVVDDLMVEVVGAVEPPQSITMRPEMIVVRTGLSLYLHPANRTTGDALARYRERLSEVTGIRFPNHDTYRFHISMGYLMYQPSQPQRLAMAAVVADAERALDDIPEFVLPSPTLRFFSDMGEYHIDPAAR